MRLDQFLTLQLTSFSRSQLTNAIKDGYISVADKPAKPGYRLHESDKVCGFIPEESVVNVSAQKIDFPVLYEDDHLLVISKPPNLVVHPGSGNFDNTLVNGLVYHCGQISGVGDPVRPGIVHRLDKDTSGVMVIAKNDKVLRHLVDSFKSHLVQKTYWALLLGVMKQTEGRVCAPIGRHPVNRKKMAIREAGGRYAVSNWCVMKTFRNTFSLTKVVIETGRTHQIRVHMASLGNPVAGDALYGPVQKVPFFPRQMLHSSELSFIHPESGKRLAITAPLWPDMDRIIKELESTG
jgi:23S rRNA pseudouridine1911/1915/1917 synthase